MAVVLTETGEFEVAARDGLVVGAADALRATGWDLKPEGMCREEACVPLPASARRGAEVDLEAFWRLKGGAVARDRAGTAWALTAGADERRAALEGLAAPDFTLPGLDGVPRTLSDLHGKKVLLVTWGSW